jgi:hypothetical protein
MIAIVLCQSFGVIFCVAIVTCTLVRVRHLNGMGMEVRVREFHLSVFPIFTIFPQGASASTRGSLPLYYSTLASLK